MTFVRKWLDMENKILNKMNQIQKEKKKKTHIFTHMWLLLCNVFIYLPILGFVDRYKYG